MRYAETGFNLEIDLSRGSIEKVPTEPKLTELHLGGLGTNAKILWDRVPPEVDPLSPDNILIFSSGILAATPATGANRTIVSTFSPQTLLMAFSMMGGFFAPELKYAGYDKVIISGKSPSLVYLWIKNDKVEIRDASHLHGKGALETADLIRQELNEPKAQVAAIGLAGENSVYYASIEHGRSSASRGGIGAVMGSKGLKAIAVRGTGDISLARPDEFIELCNEVLKYIQHRASNPIKGVPPILAGIGSPQEMAIHDEQWHTTSFAWGHARQRRKDFWTKEREKEWRETQEKAVERLISCYNCPMKCGAVVSYPALGVSKYMMKCYSKLTYVMAAMADDLDFGFRIAGRAQEYGLDSYTTPQVMAFAIELYEAGILTEEDMPGFPSRNEDRFFYLVDKIAMREGIGDVLAKGVYWAARQIGKGAEAFDHNTTKKHEQMVIKLGMLNPIYYLMYATGEKISITQIEGQMPQAPLPKDYREEFIKDWIHIPTGKEEGFKRFILEWGDEDKRFPFWPPIDLICELVDWQETMHYIDDCTGICAGLSSFPIKPPYHIHNIPLFLSAGTGLDIDEPGLLEIVRRNRNLIRAVNVRRGLRRKDEKPPEDHWKKRFPELEAKLLDEYYKFRGWNKEGIPTKEALEGLGLDYVAKDLIERGILTNGEKPSSKEASA
ncbi:MAG: aldehyde dehydrogenase [Deltaproteobacteria bacterium]|nr:aldehyde dehydrogenase [Deltaproteobacteria bacterium]MBW1918673.1 aldehyde dehydrogenase [Deltaproteobacteria bacterium]MBW1935124.1 aldehyde dehydrogenase [Deltaproteobacteria bacterium]MBW1976932.1 aldehyde dehydrogenase [Deltaproteobacteria bacterium]MBW2043516.1 aldehyde dehydrogenase [Deltaproteobacteria bacterium]